VTPPGRIAFEEVWKEFRKGPAHDTLRDLVPALTRRLLTGRKDGASGSRREAFWALRDISFDVGPGHCLGIIGGNGAGKSTTLKILTGILPPTRGRSILTGRVGSLIEVSAGFHMDLTGRENVFLQGAIMGMKREEIRRRFDQIVDFAGVGEFIDTPVKRYSSGMNARLGFSIAVHLEPDALIVDEVLSVGDASFQTNAFGRLKDMVRKQIPAIIVTHQLNRIVELCDSCIVLERGAVRFHGPPEEAVSAYLHDSSSVQRQDPPDAPLRNMSLTPDWVGVVKAGATLGLAIAGEVAQELPADYRLELAVRQVTDGRRVHGYWLERTGQVLPARGPFSWPLELTANLNTGLYQVEIFLYSPVAERVVVDGPRVLLQVEADPPFFGDVYVGLAAR
jgi:ABC-type polysaccharide/polyol phosphate transport system ATPase subunit